jgi:hypothetical protein
VFAALADQLAAAIVLLARPVEVEGLPRRLVAQALPNASVADRDHVAWRPARHRVARLWWCRKALSHGSSAHATVRLPLTSRKIVSGLRRVFVAAWHDATLAADLAERLARSASGAAAVVEPDGTADEIASLAEQAAESADRGSVAARETAARARARAGRARTADAEADRAGTRERDVPAHGELADDA